MPYSIHLLLALATLPSGKKQTDASAEQEDQADLQDVIAPLMERPCQLAERFCQQRVTPAATCRFEEQLQQDVRNWRARSHNGLTPNSSRRRVI
jgi:hypothetical protein